MVHDLNPENLHINGLIFWKIKKKSIFRVFWGIIILKMSFFRQFFTLKAP